MALAGAFRADLLANLLRAQNEDGGFGASWGRPSNTEATALAALALWGLGVPLDPAALAARAAALAWLESRQRPDGSWWLLEGIPGGTWATPWALVALQEAAGGVPPQLQPGARFLAESEGRRLDLAFRLKQALLPARSRVQLDLALVGWSWREGSASWVEPTAVALLALKKLRSRGIGGQSAAARIEEGERLIHDRSCVGGGWNYGNRSVFGVDLEPYPDVTALALVGLQDPGDPRNQVALDALERMLREDPSGLALAWASLCLQLYGRDPGSLHGRLRGRFAESGLLGETRTLALALLALGRGADLLRS